MPSAAAALDVGLIDERGFLIGFQGGFVIAGADVDVRGHVHDVSRGRRKLRQAIGAGQSAFRRVGSFDAVNVIVNGAEMIGLAANHGLERGDNFLRAFFRRAVGAPESPGMEVHSGFGEERGGIEIVGEALHHVAHGIAILFQGSAQIRFGIGGKALGQRVDVGLVALGSVGGERLRFRDGFVRLDKTVFAGRIVVIRADGFGDAPICHGEFGIEVGGALEGARGLVVIEGVNLPQALIEEGLRLRVLGGDRVMPVAVAGHERGGFCFGGGGVVGMLLRESGRT